VLALQVIVSRYVLLIWVSLGVLSHEISNSNVSRWIHTINIVVSVYIIVMVLCTYTMLPILSLDI